MARKKAELVSKRVEKLFQARGFVIRNLGNQLAVYESRKSGRFNLQVFNNIQEAKTSCGIL